MRYGSLYWRRGGGVAVSAAAGVVAAALLLLPRGARGEGTATAARLSEALGAVRVQVSALTGEDIEALASGQGSSRQARFDAAETLFVMGDMARAALWLLPLVEDAGFAAEASLPRARYYLAEAFFQLESHQLARRTFTAVLEHDPTRRADAVQRLIAIADCIGRWDGIDEAVARLAAAGPVPHEVTYQLARSLARRGRYAEALALGARIPDAAPVARRMRYLEAVAQLGAGHLDAALAGFAATVAMAAVVPGDDDRWVVDLATMNQGRILLARGARVEALDCYARVARDSPLFEQSLFETSWAHASAASHSDDDATRAELYARALDSLDLLLLEPSASADVPEAQILYGTVLARLARHDEARAAFATVTRTYEPVLAAFDRLRERRPDAAHVFLDDPQHPTLEALPPLAQSFAADERGLQQALVVARELDESAAWLFESEALWRKLARARQAEVQAHFVPELQAIAVRRLGVQHALTALARALQDATAQALDLPPAAAVRQALALERGVRATLQADYDALPHDADALAARAQAGQVAVTRQVRACFALRWLVEQQQQQLAALTAWQSAHPGSLRGSAASDFAAQMRLARGQVDALQAEQETLAEALEQQRVAAAMAGTEQPAEAALRARYEASLAREQQLLAAAAGAVPPATVATLLRQRAEVDALAWQLGSFAARVEAAMQRMGQRTDAQLEAERVALQEERVSLTAVQAAAAAAVQAVAGEAAVRVRARLDHIVARGAVGVIDVAWAQQQARGAQLARATAAQRGLVAELDAQAADAMSRE